MNLIVAYPLNENKPPLIAASENLGWEVAKQLFNFLAIFKSKPLATSLLIIKKNMYVI